MLRIFYNVRQYWLFIIAEHVRMMNMKENVLTARLIIDQCTDVLRGYFDNLSMHEIVHVPGWEISLSLADHNGNWTLPVTIKTNLTPTTIQHWRNQTHLLDVPPENVLLFTRYANPKVIENLLDAGINFVDTAGNISIKLDNPTVIVQVKGNKAPKTKDVERSRLFQPSGLAVLLTLLVDPDSLNRPYRHIANISNVSLGSVGWIMSELKNKGYIRTKNDGQQVFVDRSGLFSRWIEAYPEQLRPKITLSKLLAPEADVYNLLEQLRQIMQAKHVDWAVSGETAADILTHHLVPNELVFFTADWATQYERSLRWVPSKQGNITVLNLFSPAIMDKNSRKSPYPLTHPALVYAELINSRSERARETAGILAKKCLSDLVDAS